MRIILLYFILLLAIFTFNIECQKNRNKCNIDDMERCVQNIFITGDPDLSYPDTKEKLDGYCGNLTKNEKCIKNYASKCLERYGRTIVLIVAKNFIKFFKSTCENTNNVDTYLLRCRCFNSVKDKLDQCFNDLTAQYQLLSRSSDKNKKIPGLCCYSYELNKCFTKSLREGIPLGICSEEIAVEYHSVLKTMLTATSDFACREYIHGSEQCEQLISDLNFNISSFKRTVRTFVPPYIRILKTLN